MRLNSVQLETLRKRPQQSKLYLSIFQPQAVFKARVNDVSIAKGARVITYDTVSLGAFSSIQSGMTMWVGTTDGAMDIGKIRVRSATSTEITVSENSNIEWADNLYLTIFYYVELWPVFPRIIQNPANAEDVIFYKDYDIVYTNQNSILGTFVNMGPHRAINLDPATGQAQICWSSSGTYNLLGNSLTYSWWFQGATITGSTSAEPGLVTYNAPGHYVTRLIVTASNGATDTAYRYVSVYNSSNPSIQKWQMKQLNGSRGEGGYTASFTVFESIPIQEHAVVVLFYENWYGDTKENIGGNSNCARDIFFVGHVDKDSIEYDYEHSQVSFDAHSPTLMMKEASGFSVSVESVAEPLKWYQLLDMDSPRALYHYLRWHTTALQFTDFQFIGELYKVQFFDSDRESMYDAIDNYMKNALIGQVVSDRQGKIWMETKAEAYSNPTGTFTSVMGITNRDWMNEPSIDERLSEQTSYMEYGGVAYSGVVTGTFSALLASAPGLAPGFHGDTEFQQGMVLQGQTQLNTVLGNLFANRNSPFPSVRIDISENATNLDIAPQETVQINILASDTVRNLAINGLYIPESVSWQYEPNDFILLPTMEFNQLVSGEVGETIIIPEIEDIGDGFTVPSIDIPPYPSDFSPTFDESGDDAPPRVLVHDTTYGLIMTNTFNTERPTWFTINMGLTQAQYQNINRIVVCPNGAIYVGSVGGGQPAANSFIARADYAGGMFTILEDATSMSAKFGGGSVWAVSFNCNRKVAEQVVYVLNNLSTSKPYIGDGTTFTEGFNVSVNEQTGSVSFGNVNWIITGGGLGGERLFVFSDDIASVIKTLTTATTPAMRTGQNKHVRKGDTESVYLIHNTIDNSITRVDGNGATSVDIGTEYTVPSDFADEESSFAVDPTGQFISTVKGNAATGRGKSTDGGYTLVDIANLVVSSWRYTNCGTQSRWIAVSSYVFYTNDFFSTAPKDKRGDILTINPLLSLNDVRVLP